MTGIPGVSGLNRVRAGVRIPTPPRKTQMPRPPKIFATATKVEYVGGLQEFLKSWHPGPTTSISEGYIYWALLQVKGPMGERGWGYQVSAGGGRSVSGGAVIDFVVWDQQPRLAIRIQTERFHIATTNRKQKSDEAQRRMLERMGWKVIDIYEEHFLKDKSGGAAIQLVKLALQGRERQSPITSGASLARPGAIL